MNTVRIQVISGIFHGIPQLLNSIINPLNSRLPENLVTKRLTTKKPYNRAVPGLCELNRFLEVWLAQLALEYHQKSGNIVQEWHMWHVSKTKLGI